VWALSAILVLTGSGFCPFPARPPGIRNPHCISVQDFDKIGNAMQAELLMIQ